VLVQSVILKGLAFLFHHLSGHIADVAFIALIVIQSFILLSESTKSIEHNTLNYVAEQ
jgi:hypothetical protein